MDNILAYLEKLDLSEIEAKLYLKLLKTGPLSVRELASTTGIKRTTAYIYIDQLIEKGLLIKLVKGSHKLVAANKPDDCLQDLVEKKIRIAKSVQNEFPDVLKEIAISFPQVKEVSEAEIKYYKGKIGVKKIYEDVLQAKEQRSYVDTTKIIEVFPENFQLFNKMLHIDPDVKMFEIFQNSSEEKTETYLQFVTKHKNYFYKILPKGIELTAQDILIYDNKVAIISFNDVISGVVLQNGDLYNIFRTLFDVMWQLLPEIKNERR